MQGLVIALCRIALGAIFFIFGMSKVFLSDAFGGKSFVDFFPGFVQDALAKHPYGFYRPFLEHVIAPHPGLFAWSVALGELLIGVSLVIGFWTRWSSFFGFLLILSIHLCTNPFAEPGPVWVHLGGMLEHLSLAMLFLIFAFSGAGETLGLDKLRARPKAAKKAEPEAKK